MSVLTVFLYDVVGVSLVKHNVTILDRRKIIFFTYLVNRFESTHLFIGDFQSFLFCFPIKTYKVKRKFITKPPNNVTVNNRFYESKKRSETLSLEF